MENGAFDRHMNTDGCEKFRDMMVLRLAGKLSGAESDILSAHLAVCKSCQKEFAALSETWDQTAQAFRLRGAVMDGDIFAQFKREHGKRFLLAAAGAVIVGILMIFFAFNSPGDAAQTTNIVSPFFDGEKMPCISRGKKADTIPYAEASLQNKITFLLWTLVRHPDLMTPEIRKITVNLASEKDVSVLEWLIRQQLEKGNPKP